MNSDLKSKPWSSIDYIGLVIFGLVGIIVVLFFLAWLTGFGPKAYQWEFSVGLGLVNYFLAFLLSMALVANTIKKDFGSFRRGFFRTLFWVCRWHGYTAIGISGGAFLGMVLFVLVGGLILRGDTIASYALSGLGDGGFYLTIWSPGASLLLCVHQSYLARRNLIKEGGGT